MPRKILILEDEHPLRMLLKDNLELGNFEVIEARSGQEALDLASKKQPDLAILDLGLPDMSGWEVCRRLRQDPRYKDLPLVVLTASNAGRVEPHKTNLRINHCMCKPYDTEELLQLLRNILGDDKK